MSTNDSLKSKLLVMMVMRVVLAITFLGITSWFQIKSFADIQLSLMPLYAVIVFMGALTIVYAASIGRVNNLRVFSYFQITVDILLITVIVYITGGLDSYLNILYPLSVLGSAILLYRSGGMYAASLSGILYGVLMDMDFYKMLPVKYKVFAGHTTQTAEDVFTTVVTNITAYFIIAYLTGYLSERKERVEKRLEEKEIDYDKLENLNRHIIENISSGIFTLDEKMRITSFNREAEVVTGYSLKDVYYKDIREIFTGMSAYASLDERIGTREEKSFRRKNGDEVFLGYSISRGQGEDAAYIVIFEDLTERRAMEEQIRVNEKLKALGALSIGIAHEIRNPLASISGSIQVLRGELSLSGDNRHLMDIVVRETERLNALISDYLLFARPAKHTREVVNLTEVINHTVTIFKNSQEASKIDIKKDLTKSVFVSGDSRQLGQVLWNLFLNASHAMSDGGRLGIELNIISKRISEKSDNGSDATGSYDTVKDMAEIVISDTGKGISQDDLNQIFDPFFSTKDSGTGLGLAIVHRVIESHEGKIEVKSAPGEGTVFRIYIPLKHALDPVPA